MVSARQRCKDRGLSVRLFGSRRRGLCKHRLADVNYEEYGIFDSFVSLHDVSYAKWHDLQHVQSHRRPLHLHRYRHPRERLDLGPPEVGTAVRPTSY